MPDAPSSSSSVVVDGVAHQGIAPRSSRRRKLVVTVATVLGAFVAFLVIGNLTIVAAWQWQQRSAPAAPFAVEDVDNFEVIDEQVWRGAAPTQASYVDLARLGATTVVDLRAEDDLDVDEAALADLGLDLVHIPMRDGQIPNDDEVARFLSAVATSEGPVFVHCGAGVGRAGTMVAAYRVLRHGEGADDAVRANLAVGPPSLEQIVFAAKLESDNDEIRRPNAVVTGLSRTLDAPRRLWSRYGL